MSASGKALLELAGTERTVVPLTELALPFARHLCAHLKGCDKQATSPSNQFLDACPAFNRTEAQLLDAARLKFVNVIW